MICHISRERPLGVVLEPLELIFGNNGGSSLAGRFLDIILLVRSFGMIVAHSANLMPKRRLPLLRVPCHEGP